MTSRPAAAQHLRDLARLRRVRECVASETTSWRGIAEMMAKGAHASTDLATKDLDGSLESLQAGGTEVVQEPTDQPLGSVTARFASPRAT